MMMQQRQLFFSAHKNTTSITWYRQNIISLLINKFIKIQASLRKDFDPEIENNLLRTW
jgi:hypothetical protein